MTRGAHDYLGHLLLLRGEPQAAELEFRRAITLFPDLALFHCNLGDALGSQRRMKEAEEAYRQALALDTNSALANLRYGQLLKEQGWPGRAKMYLERAARAAPTDRRARNALADIEGALRDSE